jgi:hypothetical protein
VVRLPPLAVLGAPSLAVRGVSLCHLFFLDFRLLLSVMSSSGLVRNVRTEPDGFPRAKAHAFKTRRRNTIIATINTISVVNKISGAYASRALGFVCVIVAVDGDDSYEIR